MLPEIVTRHALLLQGPIGPFFRRLADDLLERGVAVTKVNFNAGDALFFRGPEAVPFRDRLQEWPAFFRGLVAERGPDAIFLFGDCRPIHKAVIPIARELGLAVWVFEEGYLRPDYITLERDGVNGNSRLPRDPAFYRARAAELPAPADPIPVGDTFGRSAWYAAVNASAITLAGWRYPHYRHHRDVNAIKQAFWWVRGGVRKLWFASKERDILPLLSSEYAGRYFFVPLQVHCDAQLEHSPFARMEEFIDELVAQFAAHAPADCLLVIKHHPADRPYREYGRYLRRLGARHGCADRLIYVHDLHLPTLLKHARGVITMNSTVGTSALHHRTPVKVLGTAIYDLPGLTCQRPLADFFHAPGAVDAQLFEAFCRWLRAANQLNGSFYKPLPGKTALADVRVATGPEPGSSPEYPLPARAVGQR